MLMLKLRQARAAILIFLFRFAGLFYKGKHWVICERGTDARDNGYYFYKYLKENHPEKKVYYIIDKNSADYDKVKEDAVQLRSIKNFWVAITAEKIISSHYGMILSNDYGRKVFYLSKLHEKYYFLQHGVIKDDLQALYKDSSPMKLFICGAKPEYEFVKAKFGHAKEVVQYTGLARFDNLHETEIKKQILVMPTWRAYITDRDELEKSEYFRQWHEFLMSGELLEILENTDMTLMFYLHYEMQKYIDIFETKTDRIIIAGFADYDVQTLLKESAVLITDYSSVFFDFAYMKKPMIFFQFDEEEFFAGHYKKGYFDYRNHGFGDVCTDINEVMESLKKIAATKFKTEDIYLERVKEFFPLHDQNNCKRIYEKIIKTKGMR